MRTRRSAGSAPPDPAGIPRSARASGQDQRTTRCGAKSVDRKAAVGEDADRVDAARMAGQPRRFGVRREDRGLAAHGMARAGVADHGDGAGALGRCERQPSAEPRVVSGDDLPGPCGCAAGGQHVGREPCAAPAVELAGSVAQARRHRQVADRSPNAGTAASCAASDVLTRARSPRSTGLSGPPTICCPVRRRPSPRSAPPEHACAVRLRAACLPPSQAAGRDERQQRADERPEPAARRQDCHAKHG